jgi:hypothetical protein
LHRIFNSVRVVSEDANYSADNIPKALEFVEKEINDFDEVMVSRGNFCALGAARGTATIFAKAGCNHLKMLTSLPSISPRLTLRIFQVKLKMSVTDLLPKFGRRVAES